MKEVRLKISRGINLISYIFQLFDILGRGGKAESLDVMTNAQVMLILLASSGCLGRFRLRLRDRA